MNKIGTLQRDRLEIDQVEVGLHSLRDEPPIEESDRFGIGAGQAPDQLSDVETIVGIPSPMREQEAGEAGIGDKADMRAAVAEPDQGIGIADHRPARGKLVEIGRTSWWESGGQEVYVLFVAVAVKKQIYKIKTFST